MKDQERHPPEAERIKDLEVREDEARDIAGGRKKQAVRSGKKGAKKGIEGIRHGKSES